MTNTTNGCSNLAPPSEWRVNTPVLQIMILTAEIHKDQKLLSTNRGLNLKLVTRINQLPETFSTTWSTSTSLDHKNVSTVNSSGACNHALLEDLNMVLAWSSVPQRNTFTQLVDPSARLKDVPSVLPIMSVHLAKPATFL